MCLSQIMEEITVIKLSNKLSISMCNSLKYNIIIKIM